MIMRLDIFKTKRTSSEWQTLKPRIVVLDADGWDRRNYQYAWNVERITEAEYLKRRNKSTCKWTTSPLNLTDKD